MEEEHQKKKKNRKRPFLEGVGEGGASGYRPTRRSEEGRGDG